MTNLFFRYIAIRILMVDVYGTTIIFKLELICFRVNVTDNITLTSTDGYNRSI